MLSIDDLDVLPVMRPTSVRWHLIWHLKNSRWRLPLTGPLCRKL